MGTDNLHQKRRAKSANDLGRKKANRKPKPIVLIVCEDEKSSQDYLRDLRDRFGLTNAKVKIAEEGGLAPISVYNTAKKYFDKDRFYDKVFCVFDRDTHPTFNEAINQIENTTHKKADGGQIKFQAIISVPCFEIWLLFHYEATGRPFAGTTGGKSPCDECVQCLKKHMNDYTKNKKHVFELTLDKIDKAMQQAVHLREQQLEPFSNPSTQMDILIKELQVIAGKA